MKVNSLIAPSWHLLAVIALWARMALVNASTFTEPAEVESSPFVSPLSLPPGTSQVKGTFFKYYDVDQYAFGIDQESTSVKLMARSNHDIYFVIRALGGLDTTYHSPAEGCTVYGDINEHCFGAYLEARETGMKCLCAVLNTGTYTLEIGANEEYSDVGTYELSLSFATPTSAPVFTTDSPTAAPTVTPSKTPTSSPTRAPFHVDYFPTASPTASPTKKPTKKPTKMPSKKPTKKPTTKPVKPSPRISKKPSKLPTRKPSAQPTIKPVQPPTKKPKKKTPKNN